ncbi:MAG: hypothetical protein WC549_04730, partial [Actinomycetota bacterium]
SYAVYHQTKGGMNDKDGKEYKTGKAFHIFRPHIIDAVGKETWGILHIENGIYSVEIPQDFLDKAQFPIRSNDTFGYTTVGTAGSNIFEDFAILGKFTYSGGTGYNATKVTWYTEAAGTDSTYHGNTKCAIYKDSDKSLVVATVEVYINFNSPAWTDYAISSPPALTNQNYWLAFWPDKYSYYYYDAGGTSGESNIGAYTGNFPNPLTPTTFVPDANNRNYSLYATYTPSGGGATYCGHTGGDWYVNGTCWIGTSTTTSGTLYLTETAQLNCIDGATISVAKIKAKGGTKINAKGNCKIKMWKPQ